MVKSTTFSTPFLHSSLPQDTQILFQIIYFGVKTTDIGNQNYLYYRKDADGSSMLEGVDSTVSYAPVSGILSLHIIIFIASTEGLFMEIYNALQNTILANTEERVILVYHIYT